VVFAAFRRRDLCWLETEGKVAADGSSPATVFGQYQRPKQVSLMGEIFFKQRVSVFRRGRNDTPLIDRWRRRAVQT